MVRNIWNLIRKAFLAALILGGIIVGLTMFLLIGGMGLALMGTAIGIGSVGWVGIGIAAVMICYGVFTAIRNTVRGIRR